MKTVLFDIGNVIMHFDFGPARARLARSSTVDGDPLELLAPLKHALETGKIDGPMFVSQAISTLEYRESPQEFRTTWESIFSPNEAMWRTIENARGRFRLLLLSNTSDIHRDSLFRDFEIFAGFEGGVYSYSARCAKPDLEIYRRAIAEFGLRAAETLYVDDRTENVDAGRRAGFVSLHYDPLRHERFLRDARAHGFAL